MPALDWITMDPRWEEVSFMASAKRTSQPCNGEPYTSAWSMTVIPASRAVPTNVRTSSSVLSWMRISPSTTFDAGTSMPGMLYVFMCLTLQDGAELGDLVG